MQYLPLPLWLITVVLIAFPVWYISIHRQGLATILARFRNGLGIRFAGLADLSLPRPTYGDLPDLTVFPAIHCRKAGTAIAPYTGHTPANNPPRFSFHDPSLAQHALSRYATAI
ncbi:hypothetical protein C8R44DRAFT_874157 [Mycena epipterygia]|nr:hypothetical protein C8R44DRAFT_874157 [Mycena epipterygia]